MKCSKCGAEIGADSMFCPMCGAKQAASAPAQEAAPEEAKAPPAAAAGVSEGGPSAPKKDDDPVAEAKKTLDRILHPAAQSPAPVGTNKYFLTLVLCFFCLHRIALGQVKTAIVQWISFCLGVGVYWWIFDFVTILQGTFRDPLGCSLKKD